MPMKIRVNGAVHCEKDAHICLSLRCVSDVECVGSSRRYNIGVEVGVLMMVLGFAGMLVSGLTTAKLSGYLYAPMLSQRLQNFGNKARG